MGEAGGFRAGGVSRRAGGTLAGVKASDSTGSLIEGVGVGCGVDARAVVMMGLGTRRTFSPSSSELGNPRGRGNQARGQERG